MVVIEKKRIGTVRVTRPAPTPTLTPTPKVKPPRRLEILGDFLDEHKRVKKAMAQKAGARCISRKEILEETNISEERLNMHLRILKNTNIATDVTDDMICGYASLKDLKERIEKMR